MRETLTKGTVGMVSTLAWMTLSSFETAVRVAGSLVGLTIGVVTLVSMVQKLRQDKSRQPAADPPIASGK